MRTRIISLIVIALVVCGALFATISATGKRKLTITIPAGRQGYVVGVYKATTNNETVAPETFIEDKNLVKEISSTSTLSLKKGRYVVANKKSTDYAQQVEGVTISDKPVDLTMKAAYSDSKLSDLIGQERSSVQAAVIAALPLAKNYEFATEKLYQDGSWYGAVLTVKQTTEQGRTNYVDKYRLVAQKVNGTWKLMTPVPQLILSKSDYKDIPFDVLSETNKL